MPRAAPILAAVLAAMLVAETASAADKPDTALDRELLALRAAPTEQDAASLETAIRQSWINAGSPSVKLLMGRGLRDLNADADQEALDDFDAVLALDPSLPEAWHQRALARFAMGDAGGAIRDIEETIRLEPRHFAAFETLSRIAESRHDWKGAYAAWQKVLEIDPHTPGGEERLRDLRRRALGEET